MIGLLFNSGLPSQNSCKAMNRGSGLRRTPWPYLRGYCHKNHCTYTNKLRRTYPGTTCPLFRVFQRYSLIFSSVISVPSSFCIAICHLRTSWLASLNNPRGEYDYSNRHTGFIPMKRSSERKQSGGIGEIWVGERRSHQVYDRVGKGNIITEKKQKDSRAACADAFPPS